MGVAKEKDRLGEERLSNQGCLMKIIEYNNYHNIVVEFQDDYKAKIHTTYQNFSKGEIRNPYSSSVYEKGIIGTKYLITISGKITKEYDAWHSMMRRCFDEKWWNKHPSYKNVTCCDEWLLFENFYEWLHGQENFDKWYNGKKWELDKDILIKGNKIYSPETCCLVPKYVNTLFVKNDITRGTLPVGVSERNGKFRAGCMNPFTGRKENFGTYPTIERAFQVYKVNKEDFIEQVAQEEYSKGNITKQCYDAMMNYEIEIDD